MSRQKITKDDLLKHCLYYRGEADVPVRFHGKDEAKLWIAEKYACERPQLIDYENTKRSFSTLVGAYVGKWDPYGWNEIMESYWKKSGLL